MEEPKLNMCGDCGKRGFLRLFPYYMVGHGVRWVCGKCYPIKEIVGKN